MKLLVAIPLTPADSALQTSLLSVLTSLGPYPGHSVLFVGDKGLQPDQFKPLLATATPLFDQGELIFTPIALPSIAYPIGQNFRFETAANHIATKYNLPFLWLDPRCVPTHRGWLSELEEEYFAKRKPFMGQFLEPSSHSTPAILLSSTAIYPSPLPKRMIQRLVARRGEDFEKSCAELVVPIASSSRRIWTIPSGVPLDPKRINRDVAIVHTAEALRYAAMLRGEAVVPAPEKMPEPAPAIIKPQSPIQKSSKQPVASKFTYYHSGDFGDIIYALGAIKLAGGGGFMIGPRQRKTPSAANPIKADRYPLIEPLISAQPYISKCTFSERYPGTDHAFDLNVFRTQWCDQEVRKRTGIKLLIQMHCHILHVNEKFRYEDTWLSVPSPIRTPYFIVHRSERYRNDDFPWGLVVNHFKGRILFVGQAHEHADFQRTFRVKVPFWMCADFLDLARLIAGSQGFIGNQSMPNAIALGLGQRVLQESWTVSPDCLFGRANFLTQPFVDPQLTKWESSPMAPIQIIEKAKETTIEIVSQPRRLVSTTPINGIIELGPLENATGLGDTLTITPLAQKLGARAVVCLPKEMERFAPLFDGLCPTRITDDYPVFPNPGKQRFIESKLRMFGYQCDDGKNLPIVSLTLQEMKEKEDSAVVFNDACNKDWAHVRTRNRQHFEDIIAALHQKASVKEYGTKIPVRELAVNLFKAGRYCGINTGVWHLAQAVGCRCLVLDIDEMDGYDPKLWRYDHPNFKVVGINDIDAAIAQIPWLFES